MPPALGTPPRCPAMPHRASASRRTRDDADDDREPDRTGADIPTQRRDEPANPPGRAGWFLLGLRTDAR